MFDPFTPPGYITARGSEITISSSGTVAFIHGRRRVALRLSPLQFQLLALGLGRKLRGLGRGAFVLETEEGDIKITRGRFGLDVAATGLGGTVKVALREYEAEELQSSARTRSPQPAAPQPQPTEQETV